MCLTHWVTGLIGAFKKRKEKINVTAMNKPKTVLTVTLNKEKFQWDEIIDVQFSPSIIHFEFT